MKKFYVALLLCICFLAFAQGENDNWHFGKLAAVNFSGTSPMVVNTSRMGEGQYPSEAAGTVSDSNGKLLFYTDGTTVWNRNNEVMDNGSGMSGHSSTQQLVIVKSLSNPNQYYVFIGGQFSYGNYLRYSIVDMSLGGLDSSGVPLGRVMDNSKNILVTDSSGNGFFTEAITVVPSSYGTMWILIPNGQNLNAYTVNSAGFSNGNPIVSPLNFSFPLGSDHVFSIKASPKLMEADKFSHYLCISDWSGYPDFVNKVYSFNDSTGQITSDFSLVINGLSSYSPEFNSNASVLFIGRENLYAIDLQSATPTNINYMLLASLSYACGAIQRNKYGDIYVSVVNSPYLSKILNPDAYGPGISLHLNDIYLGSNVSGNPMISGAGLPQLVEKPVYGSGNNCIPDITLVSPETNNNYIYQVSNTITAQNTYTVDPGKHITMRAGQSITLLPDTYIMSGSDYLAEIQACNIGEQLKSRKNSSQKISLTIDLGAKEKARVDIYPNPVSDVLFIQSDSEINGMHIFDMAGRKLNLRADGNKVDVKSLPAGTYLITVETKHGKFTEKFIKK